MLLTSFENEDKTLGMFYPNRFDDKPLKSRKKKCFMIFSQLWCSICKYYFYFHECPHCCSTINQKCLCGSSSNMQYIHMRKKDKFVNTDIYS